MEFEDQCSFERQEAKKERLKFKQTLRLNLQFEEFHGKQVF